MQSENYSMTLGIQKVSKLGQLESSLNMPRNFEKEIPEAKTLCLTISSFLLLAGFTLSETNMLLFAVFSIEADRWWETVWFVDVLVYDRTQPATATFRRVETSTGRVFVSKHMSSILTRPIVTARKGCNVPVTYTVGNFL